MFSNLPRIRHAIRLGFRSLISQRLRTGLTALGIVLGVASVIVMLAVGEAAQYQALKQLRDLGANTIVLRSTKPTEEPEDKKNVDASAYGLKYADLDRLRSYDLTIADLRAALAVQNVEVPGGRVDQTTRELTLRTLGRVEKVADFGDLNLASRGGVPVKLRDVATITDGVEEPRSLTRLNGTNTVSLIVRKQSGTNTVEVIRGVKARLADLEPDLPPDVRASFLGDP